MVKKKISKPKRISKINQKRKKKNILIVGISMLSLIIFLILLRYGDVNNDIKEGVVEVEMNGTNSFEETYIVPDRVTKEDTPSDGPPTFNEDCLVRLNNLQGALINKDINFCNNESEEEIINCNDEYYFYLTFLENIDYCQSMSSKNPAFKELCNMLFKNEENCDSLENYEKLICECSFNECINECRQIAIDHVRSACDYNYYIIEAVKEKDISFCEKIKNKDLNSYKNIGYIDMDYEIEERLYNEILCNSLVGNVDSLDPKEICNSNDATN